MTQPKSLARSPPYSYNIRILHQFPSCVPAVPGYISVVSTSRACVMYWPEMRRSFPTLLVKELGRTNCYHCSFSRIIPLNGILLVTQNSTEEAKITMTTHVMVNTPRKTAVVTIGSADAKYDYPNLSERRKKNLTPRKRRLHVKITAVHCSRTPSDFFPLCSSLSKPGKLVR